MSGLAPVPRCAPRWARRAGSCRRHRHTDSRPRCGGARGPTRAGRGPCSSREAALKGATGNARPERSRKQLRKDRDDVDRASHGDQDSDIARPRLRRRPPLRRRIAAQTQGGGIDDDRLSAGLISLTMSATAGTSVSPLRAAHDVDLRFTDAEDVLTTCPALRRRRLPPRSPRCRASRRFGGKVGGVRLEILLAQAVGGCVGRSPRESGRAARGHRAGR